MAHCFILATTMGQTSFRLQGHSLPSSSYMLLYGQFESCNLSWFFLSFGSLGNSKLIWCPTFRYCENFIAHIASSLSCSPILLLFLIFLSPCLLYFFQSLWLMLVSLQLRRGICRSVMMLLKKEKNAIQGNVSQILKYICQWTSSNSTEPLTPIPAPTLTKLNISLVYLELYCKWVLGSLMVCIACTFFFIIIFTTKPLPLLSDYHWVAFCLEWTDHLTKLKKNVLTYLISTICIFSVAWLVPTRFQVAIRILPQITQYTPGLAAHITHCALDYPVPRDKWLVKVN